MSRLPGSVCNPVSPTDIFLLSDRPPHTPTEASILLMYTPPPMLYKGGAPKGPVNPGVYNPQCHHNNNRQLTESKNSNQSVCVLASVVLSFPLTKNTSELFRVYA